MTEMVTIGIDTSRMASTGELPCHIVVSNEFLCLHPGRRIQLISGMADYIKKLAAARSVEGQAGQQQVTSSSHPLDMPDNYDTVALISVVIDESESRCEIDAELNGGWAKLAPWQHSKLYSAMINLLLGAGMTIARRDGAAGVVQPEVMTL